MSTVEMEWEEWAEHQRELAEARAALSGAETCLKLQRDESGEYQRLLKRERSAHAETKADLLTERTWRVDADRKGEVMQHERDEYYTEWQSERAAHEQTRRAWALHLITVCEWDASTATEFAHEVTPEVAALVRAHAADEVGECEACHERAPLKLTSQCGVLCCAWTGGCAPKEET